MRRRLAAVVAALDRGGSDPLEIAKARTMIFGLSTIANVLKMEWEQKIELRIDELYREVFKEEKQT